MTRFSRTALPALAALLAALAAGTARAQTVPSPFRYFQENQSLQLYLGYLWTDPKVELTDSTDAELGVRSAPIVGVRYNLRFGGPFSGDVGLAFIPSERKVFFAEVNSDSTVVTPVETGSAASAPLLLLEGGLRFHLTGDRTWHGLAPFVGATGGLIAEIAGTDEAEVDLSETERYDFGPAFAVGASVGLDYFPSPRFSVRVEAMGKLWRETAPTGLQPIGTRERTEWSPNTGVSIGGAFHF